MLQRFVRYKTVYCLTSDVLGRYYDLKAADLGELVKLPRMGKTLHRLVHQFPRVELAASVQPITRALLRVELTITPDFMFDQKVSRFVLVLVVHKFVFDSTPEVYLFYVDRIAPLS